MRDSIGDKKEQSEEIVNQIKKLSESVEAYSSDITGIKEADEGLTKDNQRWVEELTENRGRSLFYPYIGSGVGRGVYVEVQDGSVKMDLINGIGINIMGHSHPEIIQATVQGALSDVVMQGNLQPGKEMVRLSKKLVELASKKSRLKHSWLTTSGSMANENALKMCRQKTNGARKVVAMKAAFAGRTTLMAEITDNPSMREGLPEYDDVLRVNFYDKDNPSSSQESLDQLKEHIKNHRGDICCFMFEPMQGEGGYNVAPKEFFVPLFELCKSEGIPILNDEIQTFCRTGEFFAYERIGIGEYIDVCTVAKTLQGAATLYTDELNPKPGLIAGTFAGSAAAMSAGLKVIEILERDGFIGESGKIRKIEEKFIGMLNQLNETTCKGLLQDACGMGTMLAVNPLDGSADKRNKLLSVLYKNGLIAFGCGKGPFKIRFLIPAVMTDQDIEVAKEIIEKSVLELA
ncbi:MAG: aminotransferase class III-fold pyridoxal phosphate-dependent enzyme [Bdellovibrionales bacterium]|nr:aminotransferase class III-fold pyridoxal phosphate-dependent enzyme [Bdellovibrionales bacterium]